MAHGELDNCQKELESDISYHRAIQASLSSEWNSPEDEEAYNEL